MPIVRDILKAHFDKKAREAGAPQVTENRPFTPWTLLAPPAILKLSITPSKGSSQ